MVDKSRRMVLGLSFSMLGYHHSAWRHPDTPSNGIMDIQHYVRTAQTAERGLFDMVFLADAYGMKNDDTPNGSLQRINVFHLEPLTLLSAVAMQTKHIGLTATASTTYNEPYNLARKFASLDHISGGRAGWNMVTSWSDGEAQNFNRSESQTPAQRYARAEELLKVVIGLWNSFEDDALIADKATGLFFDISKLHRLGHQGEHFSVAGPLNMPRTPQGEPVLIMAAASEEGLDLAAAHADALYAAAQTLEAAQKFYSSVKGRMPKYGRSADSLKILPGILPVVGRTEKEAQDKFDALQSMLDPLVGLSLLCGLMGDLSAYPLDGPVPDLDLSTRGRGRLMAEVARRENLTIRQLYEKVSAGRGHRVVVGTPETIADRMEEWFVQGAADGFNILPLHLPNSLEDFVELVVPVLQSRGLMRTAYDGTTLRDNLGVSRRAFRRVA